MIDRIDLALQVATVLAGTIAFMVGLRQYREAQAWKRHEFVASEVKHLNADLLAKNAMQMIDWGTRMIELFPSHPDYVGRYVLVTRPILHAALTTHDRVGRPYTVTEAAIRDCFDAYFGGLEQFEQFVEAGLVRASEFEPYLAYWISAICEDANPELRSALSEYVRYYRFSGVSRLFARFGREFGGGAALTAESAHETQGRYEELVRGSNSTMPT